MAITTTSQLPPEVRTCFGENIMKKDTSSKSKLEQVKKHLKEDIKTFNREKKDDVKLIKKLRIKKK